MTVHVGINLGTHAIIIADKRVTQNHDDRTTSFEDSSEKVTATNNGWSARGGKWMPKSTVEYAIGNFRVRSVEDLEKILMDASVNLNRMLGDVAANSYLQNFSSTAHTYSIFDEEEQSVNVFSIKPPGYRGQMDWTVETTGADSVAWAFPKGLTDSEEIWFQSEMQAIVDIFRLERGHTLQPKMSTNLEWITKKAYELLMEMGLNNHYVSKNFDVGIISTSGFRLNAVVDLERDPKVRWRSLNNAPNLRIEHESSELSR